jgi:hypothetical protein
MHSSDTHNITRGLVRALLAITYDERHSTKMQSVCHHVQCMFSMNDHDDHNNTCLVTPTSLDVSDDSNSDGNSSFGLIAKSIHLYIYPLFILLGILGNSLSCFIMLMNVRRDGGYPASLYLTLLAFVDGLFLLGSALPDWISQFNHRLDMRLLSDFSCRFVYWFGHFTTHLSAGLVVGVTVERFIAVQYPLIAHKINTIPRTRLALAILIVFFFFLDSPVLILVQHIHTNVHLIRTCYNDTLIHYVRHDLLRCGLATERYEQAWVYIDCAVYTLIPFLIIITLNLLIIRRLLDAQRFRQYMFRCQRSNMSSRNDPSESKSRHSFDHHHHHHHHVHHQSIELMEQRTRHDRSGQTSGETRPLAIMLRPRQCIFLSRNDYVNRINYILILFSFSFSSS